MALKARDNSDSAGRSNMMRQYGSSLDNRGEDMRVTRNYFGKFHIGSTSFAKQPKMAVNLNSLQQDTYYMKQGSPAVDLSGVAGICSHGASTMHMVEESMINE